MSDYTPTMDEIKQAALSYTALASEAEWDRALAAHDAEVRAAALAEQGTDEWEYGLTWEPDVSGFDEPQSYSGCETEEGAWETGRQLAGDAQAVKVWKRPMRPAVQAVPAGPWVPVDQPASTPGVETRTPSGPKMAEVHPDAYPGYGTDRPNLVVENACFNCGWEHPITSHRPNRPNGRDR